MKILWYLFFWQPSSYYLIRIRSNNHHNRISFYCMRTASFLWLLMLVLSIHLCFVFSSTNFVLYRVQYNMIRQNIQCIVPYVAVRKYCRTFFLKIHGCGMSCQEWSTTLWNELVCDRTILVIREYYWLQYLSVAFTRHHDSNRRAASCLTTTYCMASP